MIELSFHKQNNLLSEDAAFDYLLTTMRPGVTDWEYFVDWNKVFKNIREIESSLNIMNYLLGKDDFETEFRYLAGKYPEIIKMIPVLIVRNGAKSSLYHIVTVNGATLTEESYKFVNVGIPSNEDIDNAIEFIKSSGLIRVFKKDGIRNLVDYALGVEAGLSSNGRKNRGGKAMEKVCEALLAGMDLDYITQASANDILQKFNIKLVGMEGRRFDFVTRVGDRLFVIEVNCFSSAGSKLDKTASDFRGLQDELRSQATFIWLTDGGGWQKAKNPLRKAFDHIDYIFNIELINNGALKEVLSLER